MSKIILTIAAILPGFIAVAQTEVKTQTTFGRHGTNCSSGRGACSFSVLNAEAKASDAATSNKLSEKSVVLKVGRNAISEAEEIRIAGKRLPAFTTNEVSVFVQQEAIILDSLSVKNLKLNPRYNKILPGNYPMQITKDKIEITFTLSSG